MKAKWSGAFEFDIRKLQDISYAIILWILSIYSANIELFNEILSKYVSKESYSVLIVILAYAIKKYLTNYKV